MLVETALVMLPMLAIMFGIIDVSMVVFLRGLFQSAAREGVRFAVTYSPTYNGLTCTTQSACIKQVVQDNAIGFLAGTAGAARITIRYFNPSDLSTAVTTATPPAYINQSGNVVEVAIASPWNWMVPMPGFNSGGAMTINAVASDVLQGYAAGNRTPPAP
jgi:Flp pilus assembly protein TadG